MKAPEPSRSFLESCGHRNRTARYHDDCIDPVENAGRGEHDGRQADRSSGDQHRARRPGRGAEPGWQDETTPPIDCQARSRPMVAEDQHVALGGGQGRRFGAEHLPGLGRERDASGLLHCHDLIAPGRGGSVAFPLPE